MDLPCHQAGLGKACGKGRPRKLVPPTAASPCVGPGVRAPDGQATWTPTQCLSDSANSLLPRPACGLYPQHKGQAGSQHPTPGSPGPAEAPSTRRGPSSRAALWRPRWTRPRWTTASRPPSGTHGTALLPCVPALRLHSCESVCRSGEAFGGQLKARLVGGSAQRTRGPSEGEVTPDSGLLLGRPLAPSQLSPPPEAGGWEGAGPLAHRSPGG